MSQSVEARMAVLTDHRSPITDHQAAVLAELAPTFALTGIDGQPYRLSDYAGSIDALEALLAGRQPDPAETPPYGCALVRFASRETVTPGEEAR